MNKINNNLAYSNVIYSNYYSKNNQKQRKQDNNNNYYDNYNKKRKNSSNILNSSTNKSSSSFFKKQSIKDNSKHIEQQNNKQNNKQDYIYLKLNSQYNSYQQKQKQKQINQQKSQRSKSNKQNLKSLSKKIRNTLKPNQIIFNFNQIKQKQLLKIDINNISTQSSYQYQYSSIYNNNDNPRTTLGYNVINLNNSLSINNQKQSQKYTSIPINNTNNYQYKSFFNSRINQTKDNQNLRNQENYYERDPLKKKSVQFDVYRYTSPLKQETLKYNNSINQLKRNQSLKKVNFQTINNTKQHHQINIQFTYKPLQFKNKSNHSKTQSNLSANENNPITISNNNTISSSKNILRQTSGIPSFISTNKTSLKNSRVNQNNQNTDKINNNGDILPSNNVNTQTINRQTQKKKTLSWHINNRQMLNYKNKIEEQFKNNDKNQKQQIKQFSSTVSYEFKTPIKSLNNSYEYKKKHSYTSTKENQNNNYNYIYNSNENNQLNQVSKATSKSKNNFLNYSAVRNTQKQHFISNNLTNKYNNNNQDYKFENIDYKTHNTCINNKSLDEDPRRDSYASTLSSMSSSVNQYKQNKQLTLNDFKLGKVKAEGRFGKFYPAIHKKSGMLVGIKQIKKQSVINMLDQFIQQLKIQSYVDHSNIVKLYGFFSTKHYFYIVLEYMQQGSLFSMIKKNKKISQNQTSIKLRQICSALEYLHQNQILHRDIKPENIVLTCNVCKLCDFGWSVYSNSRRRTYCGTLDYICPQILQGQEYDNCVDIWSVGVLAYEMIVGKAPFYNISKKQTMKKIVQCDLNFPSQISQMVKKFIMKALKKNPQERSSILVLLNDVYLKQREK